MEITNIGNRTLFEHPGITHELGWCDYKHGAILFGTDIQIWIENQWDFLVFWDIFVNREYPLEIVPQPGYVAKVLDLGANVGYFSLFAKYELWKLGQPCRIYAVEGDPDTYETLVQRTRNYDITTHYGLAGKREGRGLIALSQNHGTSQVVTPDSEYPYVEVPYLNLNTIIPGHIDLLKCDIEGSEFDLVVNYPDLLRRTSTVYMEIHNTKGSTKELLETMSSYGFRKHQILHDRKGTTTDLFTRV